ncbi:MAG TPA: hypothetical protein VMZ73_09375 [Acidimicrobiales bacterium]|nr:hypothetical protein [Acidimicrobiales bacterium]
MSMREQRGGTLTDLADQLPSAPANFLPDAGAASRQVLNILRNETLTQPFLATLFWHTFVRTRWFGVALGSAGVSGIGPFERIVVPHTGGDRYDLVVLVPGYEGETVAVPAEADPSDLSFDVSPGPARVLAESVRERRDSLGPPPREAPSEYRRMLSQAVAEVARVQEFGLVVASAPELELLGGVAAQPSVPVYEADGTTLAASVGVFQRDGGRVLATTALHAVKSRQTVAVGNGTGTVLRRDPVTDSCLLELDHDPFPGAGYGLNGCSRTRPPRQYIQTAFEGAGSGAQKTTTLHGFDESILDVQPFLATKLYTHPDTVPGDSGSALVEPSSDEVLGFAAYRSSMTSAQRFSAWVWAEQVYDAMGL